MEMVAKWPTLSDKTHVLPFLHALARGWVHADGRGYTT